MMQKLIARHVRDNESVISTPLIMHLVSLLDAKSLPADASLCELYDAIVRHYLQRELKSNYRPRGLADDDWQEMILVAMTRLALMIHATEPEKNAAAEADADVVADLGKFRTALKNPESASPKLVGGNRNNTGSASPKRVGSKTWWPKDAFWHESPYFSQQFTKPECEAVLLGGMLRGAELAAPDDQGLSKKRIGFIHESFLYYFLGRFALRDHAGPTFDPAGLGLGLEWFDKLVARFAEQPEKWIWPVEFLGGALDDEQFTVLLLQLLIGPHPKGLPDLVLNACRGQGARSVLASELVK